MIKNKKKPTLFDVQNISVRFRMKSGIFGKTKDLTALDNISFSVFQGETLAIVGESGCGKTTIKKILVNLLKPTEGKVLWEGDDISSWSKFELQMWRKHVQVVFQDPYGALNPRMTIGSIVADPLLSLMPEISREEVKLRVLGALSAVGISSMMLNRFPHELSGGQAQRIGIARAIICEPKCIVCDEPVSALDVAIQAQVLNLLADLKKNLNLTIIFITHDLGVVRQIADRVLVMYLGRIMEVANNEQIFSQPYHPYSVGLLNSAPIACPVKARERKYSPVEGEIPSPFNISPGCVFSSRCKHADETCNTVRPILKNIDDERKIACHKPLVYA